MNRGGLSERGAALIRLTTEISRRGQISRANREPLTTTAMCGAYMCPYFKGLTEENVYVLAMDGACRPLGCQKLFTGSLSAASVSVRNVVEYALRLNAASVVLAHNHVSGVTIPSQDDVNTTIHLARALHTVDVLLADHIVVAGDQFTSMAELGLYRPTSF